MEKRPFVTEAQVQNILPDVPTPFHIYDEKGIRENARRINKAFSCPIPISCKFCGKRAAAWTVLP